MTGHAKASGSDCPPLFHPAGSSGTNPSPGESPAVPRSRWARWLDRAALAIGLLSLSGLLVRLTIRDASVPFSTLFYATPLPLLSVGVAFFAFRQRQVWWRRAFVALALVLAAWTVATHWGRHAPRGVAGKAVKVLFWNTGRGAFSSSEGIAAEVTQAGADIVVLVEAVPWKEPDTIRQFWREACPQYRPSILGGGIVLLSRFPSGETTTADLPLLSITRQVEVDCDGHPLTLLICDLGSNPFRSRQAVLMQVAEAAERLIDRPALVLGDFNTPPDSAHFGPLRKSYRNVFETAGTGYLATWPMPAPVLCLDQMWINGSVEPGNCKHLWTVRSDHRPVLAELGLP